MILRSVSPELIVEIAKERHHYGYSYFFLILALVMLRADNNDNFDKPLCQHIYFALLSLSLKSLKSLHLTLSTSCQSSPFHTRFIWATGMSPKFFLCSFFLKRWFHVIYKARPPLHQHSSPGTHRVALVVSVFSTHVLRAVLCMYTFGNLLKSH